MFEFLRFELIVHDSAGGVVFRVVTWIITVINGAVRALCENAPFGANRSYASKCSARLWRGPWRDPGRSGAPANPPPPFSDPPSPPSPRSSTSLVAGEGGGFRNREGWGARSSCPCPFWNCPNHRHHGFRGWRLAFCLSVPGGSDSAGPRMPTTPAPRNPTLTLTPTPTLSLVLTLHLPLPLTQGVP